MKFYSRDIGYIAGRFLETLDDQNISNVEDLRQKVGNSVTLDPRDSIIFDEKRHSPPSGIGISYIASYQRENLGIPIECRVNDIAGTVIVIVKSQEILQGYSQMFPGMLEPDKFGNIAQDKARRMGNFNWVIKELESLSKFE